MTQPGINYDQVKPLSGSIPTAIGGGKAEPLCKVVELSGDYGLPFMLKERLMAKLLPVLQLQPCHKGNSLHRHAKTP